MSLNVAMKKRTSKFFLGLPQMTPDDEKFIEEYTLTTFDKVLFKMRKIRDVLISFKASEEILTELEWIVDSLRNKPLFEVDMDTTKEEDLKILSKKYEALDISDYAKIISSYSRNSERKF